MPLAHLELCIGNAKPCQQFSIKNHPIPDPFFVASPLSSSIARDQLSTWGPLFFFFLPLFPLSTTASPGWSDLSLQLHFTLLLLSAFADPYHNHPSWRTPLCTYPVHRSGRVMAKANIFCTATRPLVVWVQQLPSLMSSTRSPRPPSTSMLPSVSGRYARTSSPNLNTFDRAC